MTVVAALSISLRGRVSVDSGLKFWKFNLKQSKQDQGCRERLLGHHMDLWTQELGWSDVPVDLRSCPSATSCSLIGAHSKQPCPGAGRGIFYLAMWLGARAGAPVFPAGVILPWFLSRSPSCSEGLSPLKLWPHLTSSSVTYYHTNTEPCEVVHKNLILCVLFWVENLNPLAALLKGSSFPSMLKNH